VRYVPTPERWEREEKGDGKFPRGSDGKKKKMEFLLLNADLLAHEILTIQGDQPNADGVDHAVC
jgi:hypothetical protein